MRHLGFAVLYLLAFAAAITLAAALGVPPAGASSSPATPAAEVPAASAAPTLTDRLADLEAARAKLVQQCQVGIAQHDGAIAVVKQLIGVPAGTTQ